MLFGTLKRPSIRKNISSIFKKSPKITEIVNDAEKIAKKAQELIEKELEPEVSPKEPTMMDFLTQEEITKIIIEMNFAKMSLKKQLSILEEASGGHIIPQNEYKAYVEHIFKTLAEAQKEEKESEEVVQ